MAQFEGASTSFVADKRNLANMTDPSDKGRRWGNFSEWMFDSFRKQVAEENERIERELAQAAMKKEQAKIFLMAAGMSFVIFLLFTLMLVLIAIERNTRPVVAAQPKDRPLAPELAGV